MKPFLDEQKAGFDRLERSGYLPMLREWILTHSAAFFWHDHEGKVCHNGTVSLVDTGTQKLAITAEHVFRKYLLGLAAGRIFKCQFGGVVVSPEELRIEPRKTDRYDLTSYVHSDQSPRFRLLLRDF